MTLLNDMHEDWDEDNNDTRPAIVTLHTSGDGWWSECVRPVGVTELALGYVDDENRYGELLVHFNTDTWRPDHDGLIYTDEGFMAGLSNYLTSIGLDASDVYYSEQGMQGDNYVSLDIGPAFIASWNAKK